MERALYLDPVSGISGNMFVGVLLDLGVPRIWLINELQKLGLDDYELIFEKVNKRGITATYFNVDVQETTTHRHLPDILTILARADWSGSAKQRAASIFWSLALAESRAHGIAPEDVHFHEVGAVDCIIDCASIALGLEYLDIDIVLTGPVATGSGTIRAAHGELSVPAPATQFLLQGFPTITGTPDYELTTPTGAAALATFAVPVEKRPSELVIDRVGYGAGTYDLTVSNTLGGYYGQLLPIQQWQVPSPYIFGQNP